MFYKQFLTITDIFNEQFVENFDYWLATLPTNNKKNITASVVSSRLDVSYSLAEAILKFAEKQGILERYYIAKCPECDFILAVITKDEIPDLLVEAQYCEDCEDNRKIKAEDIYTAYKVVLNPDVTEEQIARAIEERLNQGESADINFIRADSLANDSITLYEAFYSPSESAYEHFSEMRETLDWDYGKNTTAKGEALEKLILDIFNTITMVRGTNDVKTKTNQFDCTFLSGLETTSLSVFSYLKPYFIIECKNEAQKKPDNTYCNKLLSIMETNEAQFGIVFGRSDATAPCHVIAREHYLVNRESRRQKIIITCSDMDLNKIIDERVNLLQYLEFKIMQVTAGTTTSTFEMFKNGFERN